MSIGVLELVVATATVLGTVLAAIQVVRTRAPAPPPLPDLETAEWKLACDADTADRYEAVIKARPNGQYAAEARRRLDRMTAGLVKVSITSSDGSHETRWLKPGEAFQDCPDWGVLPELVVVSSGSFVMGSAGEPPNDEEEYPWERPQHRVEIARAFAVGKYPITFEEWDAYREIIRARGAPIGDAGWGRGRRPVINVSWHHAAAYIAWLSSTTGQKYRLLSEAEWEYCCRAGTTTEYSPGPAISQTQARYGADCTVPVGSYPPNAFGLCDMHGNIYEWCEDWWHASYESAPADGSAWMIRGEDYRVMRGGSWYDDVENEGSDDPWYVRCAARWAEDPQYRSRIVGFRVARELEPPENGH